LRADFLPCLREGGLQPWQHAHLIKSIT
jgi:hypothetical protein